MRRSTRSTPSPSSSPPRSCRWRRPSSATARVCSSISGLRFAAFPYLAGRAPELDDKATLTLLGRTLARMHAIGNRAPFRHRPALDPRASRRARARHGAAKRLRTRGARGTICARQRTGHRTSPTVPRELRTAAARCASTAIAMPATSCGARTARCSSISTTACPGPRIQDLWMFLSGDAASQQSSWAAIMEGYELFGEFDFAELTLVEALRSSAHPASRRVDREPLARSGVSARLSVVRRRAFLGAAHRRPVRAARGDGRSAHPVEIAAPSSEQGFAC